MICFDFTIMPCVNIKNMSSFLWVVQLTVKTMNKCDSDKSLTNQANFRFQKEGSPVKHTKWLFDILILFICRPLVSKVRKRWYYRLVFFRLTVKTPLALDMWTTNKHSITSCKADDQEQIIFFFNNQINTKYNTHWR